MKLSISNIGWDSADDEQMYVQLQKRGFSGLEIAPTRLFKPPVYEKISEATDLAKRLKGEFGLEISSMQSIWFGRTESIFGTERERAALVEYTKCAIDFARAAGCANLVFGCPKNRNKPVGATENTAEKFFAEIGGYAAQNSCTIALEANPPIYNTNYINTTQEAFALAERLGAGIAVNLDFGTIIHNNESLESVRNNLGRISHIHISEPYLAPIEKRELHYELADILRSGGYDKYVSIEMKSLLLDTVLETLEYISEVFG
ncbi:MAG: sugar phosphate isomerase/epimerase family protein [Oscillospiraceae bacterium]